MCYKIVSNRAASKIGMEQSAKGKGSKIWLVVFAPCALQQWDVK